MLSIEKVDTERQGQAKRFVQFYYDLYKDCPQLVPPPFGDAYLPLNRKKHPFFEHSDADFFRGRPGRQGRRSHLRRQTTALQRIPQDEEGPLLPVRCRRRPGGRTQRSSMRPSTGPRQRGPRYHDRPEGPLPVRRLRHPGRRLRASPDDDHDELQLRLLSQAGGSARLREGSRLRLLLSSGGGLQGPRAGRSGSPSGLLQRGNLWVKNFKSKSELLKVGLAHRRGLQQDFHQQLGILSRSPTAISSTPWTTSSCSRIIG